MNKGDLKKGVVYLHDGTCGADGANILFSVVEDGSYDYHPDGCIILHWSGNRLSQGGGGKINKYHLKDLTVASKKATKYYNKCVKAGKDVGGFSWHDSNK